MEDSLSFRYAANSSRYKVDGVTVFTIYWMEINDDGDCSGTVHLRNDDPKNDYLAF